MKIKNGHMPTSHGSFPQWIIFLLILVGAFSINLLTQDTQFQRYRSIYPGDEGVHFNDIDSYYHMRRAEWISYNYPNIPYEDPYLYYPEKGIIPWPGGFDFVLGSIFKLFHYFELNKNASEYLICFINPIISLLITVVVFFMGLYCFDFLSAILAMIWLSLSPLFLGYAAYGNVDHHILVALFMSVIGFLLHLSFNEQNNRISVWAVGVTLGIAHFFHPGFSTVTAILIFIFLSRIVLTIVKGETLDVGFALKMRRIFASSCLVTFIVSLSTPFGRDLIVDYGMLSLFQPLLLLIGLATVQAVLYFLCKLKNDIEIIILIITLSLLAFFAGYRNWPMEFLNGFQYALGDSWFLGLQGESKSPFEYGFDLFFKWYSVSILIIPVIAAILMREIWSNWSEGQGDYVFFVYAFCIIATGFGQMVFSANTAVFIALFCGGSVLYCRKYISTLMCRKGIDRAESWATAVVCALFVVSLVPLTNDLRISYQKSKSPYSRSQDIALLCSYIEHTTPSTSGFFSRDIEPEYSILANRDLGHRIIYRGHRPVIVNPFGIPRSFIGHTRDFAKFNLSQNPDDTKEILDRYRSRYVIIDPLRLSEVTYYADMVGMNAQEWFESKNDTTHLKEDYYRLLNTRMYMFDGSLITLNNKSYSGISYLRLIFESRNTRKLSDKRYPEYKLYQVVKGAILEGGAEPGTIIKCSLKLASNTGREFVYSNYTISNENGFWRMIYPYPTTEIETETDVHALSRLEMSVGEKKYLLDIGEKDVLEGNTIRFGQM